MRDEKAIPASETEDGERAAAKSPSCRISDVPAPFVDLPPLDVTDRIHTLEIKLQYAVKMIKEEAEHRKKVQSRSISELSDRLDTMAKQSDRNRQQIIKQFQQVERRFAAFESALHHLEKSGPAAGTVSENEDRQVKREKVVFDTLEIMQSRLEDLELTVGRMEDRPFSEIKAQITALRNGQSRLKEQLSNLEGKRPSAITPGPANSSRTPTPHPLARVKLESINASHANLSENEAKKDALAALRSSIEAFQNEEKNSTK